jgi:hypothetical protein
LDLLSNEGIKGIALIGIAEGIQADTRGTLHQIVKRGCRYLHVCESLANVQRQRLHQYPNLHCAIVSTGSLAAGCFRLSACRQIVRGSAPDLDNQGRG